MANAGCAFTVDAGRAAAAAPLESQAKHGPAKAHRSASFAELVEHGERGKRDSARSAENFIVPEK